MKTTFGKIYDCRPCKDGWAELCNNRFGTKFEIHMNLAGMKLTKEQFYTEISILEILESNGIELAVRALATQKYRDYCLFSADVAESVLHIYEKEYPGDLRVRNLIEGIRKWYSGEINDEELEKLLEEVATAADAAYDADAEAAAYAAYAVEAATNAAVYASANAAEAVYVAAHATAYAVVAREEQWDKIEKLLRKHLKRGERR